MRILLDECVPARLARELTGHEVRTVVSMRWGSMKDGLLLQTAATEFDVLLTVDQSLEHQQTVPVALSLLTIVSRSIRYEDLKHQAPQILEALSAMQPGERCACTGHLSVQANHARPGWQLAILQHADSLDPR